MLYNTRIIHNRPATESLNSLLTWSHSYGSLDAEGIITMEVPKYLHDNNSGTEVYCTEKAVLF